MSGTISIVRAGRATPLIVQIDEKCLFFKKLMADHRITCDVNVSTVLDIKIGDFITWNGNPYTINRLPTVEKTSLSQYHYVIYFEADVYSMGKKIFIDINEGNGLAQFSLNETATGFLEKIVANLNVTQPTWTGIVTGDTGGVKTLQFANESCKSVLTRVAQAFGFEYDVVGKAISLKTTISTALGYSFEYGRDNGLYKIERQQVADQNILTKVWGFGSTKNIPFSYRDGAQRLVFEVDSKRYVEDTESDYGVIEGQFTDESIYPHWPGVLTGADINFDGGTTGAVARCDKVVKDTTPEDCTVSCNGYSYTMDWNTDVLTTLNGFMTAHENGFGSSALYRINILGDCFLLFIAKVAGVDFTAPAAISAYGTAEIVQANVEASGTGGDFNFSTSYLEDTSIYFDAFKDRIEGEPVPKIVFTSGACSGIEFEVYRFDFATKRIYFYAYKDADGTTIPRYNDGSPIQPEPGDTYTFINIQLPQEYIDAAETELYTATLAYLNLNKNPQVVYTVDIDPKYALTETIDDINPGDTVELTDTELIGPDHVHIRIASIEYPLVNIYKIKAVISDTVPYTFNEQIIKTVVTNTLNNIFLETRLTEMIRESELRQKKLTVPKEIIPFTNTEVPTISNYQTTYAVVHGQYPSVKLWMTIDSEKGLEDMQNPLFTFVNGLIDTIRYETGNPDSTGYIILQ